MGLGVDGVRVVATTEHDGRRAHLGFDVVPAAAPQLHVDAEAAQLVGEGGGQFAAQGVGRGVGERQLGALAVLRADTVGALLPPRLVEEFLGLGLAGCTLGLREVDVGVLGEDLRDGADLRGAAPGEHLLDERLAVHPDVERTARLGLGGDRHGHRQRNPTPVGGAHTGDLEAVTPLDALGQARRQRGAVDLPGDDLLHAGVVVLDVTDDDLVHLGLAAAVLVVGHERGLVRRELLELERARANGLGVELGVRRVTRGDLLARRDAEEQARGEAAVRRLEAEDDRGGVRRLHLVDEAVVVGDRRRGLRVEHRAVGGRNVLGVEGAAVVERHALLEAHRPRLAAVAHLRLRLGQRGREVGKLLVVRRRRTQETLEHR